MDIDRFIASNGPLWDRLTYLAARAERRVSRLSAGELEEMVRLYQRTTAHLSYARTYYRDPALVLRLSEIVANAGGVVYGTRPRTFTAILRFFRDSFPAAVWQTRRFIAVSAFLLFAPAAALAIWLAQSPRAIDALGPPALREAYVERDFEEYYSSDPAAQFSSEVFVNNARIGLMVFALGPLTAGVGTAYVLVLNGANLGVVTGLFVSVGQQPKFWGLIIPHGLLELTAVVMAGGAGLRMGWALIVPGDRSRTRALGEEGKKAFVVAAGLIVTFAVAGLIEGFVTGSPLPTAARVGVGVAAEVAFLTYLGVLGPAAVARGATGALDDGQSRPVAFTRR